MTPFEYILTLASVIVGLAIADPAVSVHRLLRARRRVRWHWLPLAATLLAVLAVLELWWIFYSLREEAFFTTLGGFLPVAAQLILVFLLTAAALPDSVPAEGLDLGAFYDENGPYFWSLYAVYVGFVIVVKILGLSTGTPVEGVGSAGVAFSLLPNMVLLVLFVTLARSRRRSLHTIAVLLLLGLFLAQWYGLQLGTLSRSAEVDRALYVEPFDSP